MSFNNRENFQAPVYTIYPEGYHANVNYGFQQNQPQTSPPKYEDVISGRLPEQSTVPQAPGTYEGPEQGSVIYIAPVYKYTRAQKTIGLIFTVLFLTVFVSILIKFLSFR